MSSTPYTADFYERMMPLSEKSAKRIVPVVLEWIRPRSVLDVGCGVGHFLRAFQEAGVADIKGIDGDYVPADQLVVDAGHFAPVDLKQAFDLRRQYDLVLSLEVAEHLPADAAAGFVQSLVRHGDLILFSAAVPHQGGTHHVNEQWPSYWSQLFAGHGYRAYDVLRPALWGDAEIAWWYRQNLLLFVKDSAKARVARLAGVEPSDPVALDRVHPELYAARIGILDETAAQLKKLLDYLSSGSLFDVVQDISGKFSLTKRR